MTENPKPLHAQLCQIFFIHMGQETPSPAANRVHDWILDEVCKATEKTG
jgi:hypothetical protein